MVLPTAVLAGWGFQQRFAGPKIKIPAISRALGSVVINRLLQGSKMLSFSLCADAQSVSKTEGTKTEDAKICDN